MDYKKDFDNSILEDEFFTELDSIILPLREQAFNAVYAQDKFRDDDLSPAEQWKFLCRCQLAVKMGKSIYDPYFDSLTLPQLIFEKFYRDFVSAKEQGVTKDKVLEAINQNDSGKGSEAERVAREAEEFEAGFAEAEEKAIKEMEERRNPAPPPEDDPWHQIIAQAKTGKFVGEE